MITKKKNTNAHGQRMPRRPRWVPVLASEDGSAVPRTLSVARARASRATDDEITTYLAPLRASFEALRQGIGRGEHVRILFALYWVGTALETTGGIGGLQDEIEAYGQTLEAIERRCFNADTQTWGQITLHAQELAQLRNGIELHDTQLLNCTWGEFMKARELACSLCRQAGGTVVSREDSDAVLAKVLEGGV